MTTEANTITGQPATKSQGHSGNITLTGGDSIKPWADTPYTLIADTTASHPSNAHIPEKHYCRDMAYIMAQIHNTILRGINSIYNQAGHIKPGTADCEDFIFYNRCVYDFLHHHHRMEEEIFFPSLREVTGDPAFCDVLTKEHDVFDAGAEKWKEYIYTVRPEEYDGLKLKALIEGFGLALHDHLVAEIAWLLSMSKYDSNACKKAFMATDKKASADASFYKWVLLLQSRQDQSVLSI